MPQISPYNEAEDNRQLGTEGTYSLRQLLSAEYLEVALMIPAPTMGEDAPVADSVEITIKSAKGLTNIAEYLKDKGLIKIGGPKAMSDGEIDAHEKIIFEKKNLRLREEYPFDQNTIKFSEADSEHGFRVMKLD